MEYPRSDDAGSVKPRAMKVVPVNAVFKEEDLLQLHQLRGGFANRFRAQPILDDLSAPEFLHVLASARVPNVLEIPPEITKLVGWVRGRIEEIEEDERPYVTVEGEHIDTTVHAETVRKFLLRNLQQRVSGRKSLSGVRLVLPGGEDEKSPLLRALGFKPSRALTGEDLYVWRKPSTYR